MVVIIILTALISAQLTFHLHAVKKLNVVLASALPSLVFALAYVVLSRFISLEEFAGLPAVFFGASFVGMSSNARIRSSLSLSLAAIVFAVVYLSLSLSFKGYGGGLGTSAAVAVLISISFESIIFAGINYLQRKNASKVSK